jgi:hypothetical protein
MLIMGTSKVASAGFVVLALAVSACAGSSNEGVAPEVDSEGLDGQDNGATWNGWTQTPLWRIDLPNDNMEIRHTFTRSSGDATRGGGMCMVTLSGSANFQAPTTCTDGSATQGDSLCTTAARNVWGSQAYGYCYGGYCYDRMGSQATDCLLGSNRSPGTVVDYRPGAYTMGDQYALGCMTKTAGPNTACGCTFPTTATPNPTYTSGTQTGLSCGTSYTSLYMRRVVPAQIVPFGGGGGGGF